METQQIEIILRHFFDQMATIQQYQRLSKKITEKIIKDLYEQNKQLETFAPENREIFEHSRNVFGIYDPYTGEYRPYAVKKSTIKETARLVHFHKNKQYQWLLVEAYELFEDFIISIYELIRESAPEFRLNSDKKPDKDLSFKDLKRKVPQILNQFREKIAELKVIEQENKVNKDLRFYLKIIEKFRHIIVHKSGKTSDMEYVTNKILKESCLFSDKAREPVARAIINDYFGAEGDVGLIVLVEKVVSYDRVITCSIDRHENLMNVMLSYAFVLSRCLINYLSDKQT